MRLTPNRPWLGIVCALLLPLSLSPASAQDYLGSFLRSQQDANIREIQQDRRNTVQDKAAGGQRDASRLSPAQLADVKARLKVDYERRVREQGQAKADQWLRDTAYRLGQQQGRSAPR